MIRIKQYCGLYCRIVPDRGSTPCASAFLNTNIPISSKSTFSLNYWQSTTPWTSSTGDFPTKCTVGCYYERYNRLTNRRMVDDISVY